LTKPLKHLSRLNPYFWKYRGRFFLGILFIMLSNVFNVYAPVLIGEGIDFLAQALSARESFSGENAQVSLPAPSSISTFFSWFGTPMETIEITPSGFAATVTKIGLWLAIGYLIFYVLKGIFLFFQRQTIIVMSRYIEFDLKNQIYAHYQKLDMSFYRRNRTGDLMNRISEDVNRVRMYLGPAVMYTINLIVLVIMCIVVMWNIDSELTLYTLSPLPFMGLAIFYVSTIINRRTEKVQRRQSELSSMVQESVSGIRLLRAYGRETHTIHQFTEASDVYKQKQLELVRADALFMPVIVLLVGLSTILTIYVGSQKVIAGTLSYGVIVQFVFYVIQLTWPFASVGWVTSLVQKAEASQQRINEFLEEKPSIENPDHAIPFEQGDIVFDKVTFTYPETGVKALDAVSFRIPQGETVALVGRTGSGKTTVANLLLRMVDPDHGSVRINGQALTSLDLSELRAQTGFVPQDVFLFSDTVRNNIAFGVEQASEESIKAAAKMADIHESILSFSKGYDTRLGERGINLSGGQKQRVSIARALLKNAPVLVFDDCLSAVDTDTEETILSSLQQFREGKTTLVIAHRISSIRNAHLILVLDHGRLAEEGTHEELLSKNGLYAAMYERQQLESTRED